MKEYGYDEESTHSAIIFEKGTEAHGHAKVGKVCMGNTPGLIVGSSEWGWISEDNAKRICAALQYFSETPTDLIESMANSRFK